jgi:hypothetical protein
LTSKNQSMTSVITGDIIGSRRAVNPEKWLVPLKEFFNTLGKEPEVWQFFRGDSFQLEIKEPQNALFTAIQIKALTKCIKGLDVRMAIGIGSKTYDSPKITEANGDAFVFSGSLFEKMKKKTLAIKSPWEELDKELNLYLDLALLTMDKWTQNSAEIVKITFEMPEATQTEVGVRLKITQGRISDRQKRAGLEEIQKMEQRYRKLITDKIGKL